MSTFRGVLLLTTFDLGVKARRRGRAKESNPFNGRDKTKPLPPEEAVLWKAWCSGWLSEDQEIRDRVCFEYWRGYCELDIRVLYIVNGWCE